MDISPIDLISRWIHVGTAVVLLGGAVFSRYALLPSSQALAEAERATFRDRVASRWKMFVMIGILLLLASGFWNYLAVTAPQHKGDSLYNALMGIKILLAFVVFFLASALVGRSAKLGWVRNKAALWQTVVIVVGFVIVMIAGYLKLRGVTVPGVVE